MDNDYVTRTTVAECARKIFLHAKIKSTDVPRLV